MWKIITVTNTHTHTHTHTQKDFLTCPLVVSSIKSAFVPVYAMVKNVLAISK